MISTLARVAIATSGDDYAAAVSTFRDSFGMPVDDFSPRTVPDLGAYVGMCQPAGGSNVELMAPADPDRALAIALQRFLDRRGQGPYALMLEAPSPNDEARELAERGLNVLPLMEGAGGRDLHPNSTHGVLIRIYPDGSVAQPPNPVSAEPGLTGITRVVVATGDAGAAAKTYGYGIGLEVTEPEPDTERGVLVALAKAPTGATIELVSVLDSERPFGQMIENHLTASGMGIVGLVLGAKDPAGAATLLGQRGLDAHTSDEIGQPCATAFGMKFWFE